MYLNIARAADDIGVSPGAVSQQITILEKWLGAKLFFRTNRGLKFSEAGKTYYKSISSVFNEIRIATNVTSRPNVRKSFVISVTATFAMKWLLPKLSKFREKWPDIEISVTTVELVGSFSSADGDVGLRYGTGDFPLMKSVEIIRDNLILVAAPNLTIKPDFNITSISDYPLLMDRHPKVIAEYPNWEDYLSDTGVTNPGNLSIKKFSQQWMVIEAAKNGEGIALVKSCLISDDINSGKLVQLSKKSLKLKSGYYLVHIPEIADDPIIKSFHNWIMLEAKA